MLKNYQEMLEYGFEILNQVYYNNELPPIVITIMSSPKTNGHFTVNPEWRVEDKNYNEINISAEHLDRPIENVMATLQHEMVHYYCQLNNIQDTSQGGRYHNKRFKEEAEKRGLLISQAKYIGWSVTQPGVEFMEVLKKYGIEKPINMNRDGYVINNTGFFGMTGGVGVNGTDNTNIIRNKKTSTRKYECPCCGNSFRATKDINVLCMDCNEQYIKLEK